MCFALYFSLFLLLCFLMVLVVLLFSQDLVSMANNIAKCIYPQSALPTNQKPKVIAQKVVSQKPKDKLVYVPPASGVKEVKVPVIEAEQPTSIDVVVLVDTSENAVNDKSISSVRHLLRCISKACITSVKKQRKSGLHQRSALVDDIISAPTEMSCYKAA